MKYVITNITTFMAVFFMDAYAFASPSDKNLENVMESYWESYLDSSPIMANFFGDMRNKDKLDQLSTDAFAKIIEIHEKAIDELKKVSIEELTDENRINYQVFEWVVTNERKTLDYDWRFLTFNTFTGWQTAFAQLSAMTTFSSEADYRDYLLRLNDFGRYAQENMALMQRGIEVGYVQPCVVLEGYEESISGFISKEPEKSIFFVPFKNIPKSYGKALIADLRTQGEKAVDNVVNPAYERYLDFYTNTYKPACRSSIALSALNRGRELYDHFVRYYTTMDTNADRVHVLGLKEVKRIKLEMKKIIEETGFEGSFKDFLHMLRTDLKFYPKDAESYLAKARSIAKRIDGKLPQYFSYLPRNPYGVYPVPAAIAPKTATAYYQPGANDGTRAGAFFLNTWNLKSRPLYGLTALTLHESVPGHHQQISIQGEMKSLPQFRRNYYFHAYGEGWGLYSEFLGEEMGVYETPYDRFGRLTYEMWRACRLVVDTGMHAKDWTRQQAIDFMADNTALSLHNITSEVDRYITYPGQALAYKHGELKIRELRTRAEKVLGKEFSLREFHTIILTNGAVPLTVLETIIDRWIAGQKN